MDGPGWLEYLRAAVAARGGAFDSPELEAELRAAAGRTARVMAEPREPVDGLDG